MPAKAKFSRDEIIAVALSVVREEGMEKLTSRKLAGKLGSSSAPVFTVFRDMTEVKDGVKEEARRIYRSYMERALLKDIPFRAVGEEYVHFAYDEPRLFQLLFMNGLNATSLADVLPALEESYQKVISSVMDIYHLDVQKARELYGHLWIYAHGMACLTATGTSAYTPSDVQERLSDVFFSLMLNLR